MDSLKLTAHLPDSLQLLENRLRSEYLSDDFQAVCAVASASDHMPFVAAASASLEDRKAVFEEWRQGLYGRFAGACPDFIPWMGSLDQETAEKVRAGQLTWFEIETACSGFIAHQVAAAAEKKRAGQARMRESLAALLHDRNDEDAPGKSWGRLVPSSIVVLADGTVKFFNKVAVAKSWARKQRQDFLFADLHIGTGRLYDGVVQEEPSSAALGQSEEESPTFEESDVVAAESSDSTAGDLLTLAGSKEPKANTKAEAK